MISFCMWDGHKHTIVTDICAEIVSKQTAYEANECYTTESDKFFIDFSRYVDKLYMDPYRESIFKIINDLLIANKFEPIEPRKRGSLIVKIPNQVARIQPLLHALIRAVRDLDDYKVELAKAAINFFGKYTYHYMKVYRWNVSGIEDFFSHWVHPDQSGEFLKDIPDHLMGEMVSIPMIQGIIQYAKGADLAKIYKHVFPEYWPCIEHHLKNGLRELNRYSTLGIQIRALPYWREACLDRFYIKCWPGREDLMKMLPELERFKDATRVSLITREICDRVEYPFYPNWRRNNEQANSGSM